MSFQCYLSFFKERAGDMTTGVSNQHSFFEGIGLGHEKTRNDEEDGRAGAEPVEWTPSVGCSVDQAACEGCREEISEGISLLQHSTDQSTGSFWTILESCSGGVSVLYKFSQ